MVMKTSYWPTITKLMWGCLMELKTQTPIRLKFKVYWGAGRLQEPQTSFPESYIANSHAKETNKTNKPASLNPLMRCYNLSESHSHNLDKHGQRKQKQTNTTLAMKVCGTRFAAGKPPTAASVESHMKQQDSESVISENMNTKSASGSLTLLLQESYIEPLLGV